MFKSSGVNEIMPWLCDATVTVVLNGLRNKQIISKCHGNKENPTFLSYKGRSKLQALFAQMMDTAIHYGTYINHYPKDKY